MQKHDREKNVHTMMTCGGDEDNTIVGVMA